VDSLIEARFASVIIPTFNGAARIPKCLDALLKQVDPRIAEILVVDDGSTDGTGELVRRCPGVRLLRQANAGPASARNRGASEATGEVILFTDDDCVPAPEWLDAMLGPFTNPSVVGTKGIYRTRQRSVVARFVQIEYEDRYRLMRKFRDIDFVDTYSAAFRRERFLELGGYDTSFPVACAEDIELSYRMSERGWKMKFAPKAVVFHTHPDTLSGYLRKKYKFAFWRVLALRKNPAKALRDSHTPQLMKLQLLFVPALLTAVMLDLTQPTKGAVSLAVLGAFLITTVPFAVRAFVKDPTVGLLSPALLAVRACAQLLGVINGLLFAGREPARLKTNSPARN
jgi:cellulose synthase/poly-beta-1,6-N-acetylglucosamine synthase-like glycosyltransferase